MGYRLYRQGIYKIKDQTEIKNFLFIYIPSCYCIIRIENQIKILVKHIVTGGAGFLGSHLIDKLMSKGHEVICLDNFFTGNKENIVKWIDNPKFELIRHDIT